MLSNAFALAVLTTSAFIIVYQKLPRKIRRMIEKYSLVSDLLALIGVYLLLGGTLTALVAGAMVGLFVSVLLHIANNPDDYLYLYDMRDFLKEKMAEAKEALNTYGQTYRKNKAEREKSEQPEFSVVNA